MVKAKVTGDTKRKTVMPLIRDHIKIVTIIMSDEYELVFRNTEDAVFGKEKLLMSTDRLKTRLEFLRRAR